MTTGSRFVKIFSLIVTTGSRFVKIFSLIVKTESRFVKIFSLIVTTGSRFVKIQWESEIRPFEIGKHLKSKLFEGGTRYQVNITLTYHNVLMGSKQEMYSNHAAINTIIMAVKKRICYKERLKCYNPSTISGIIEGRIKIEKYVEKKNGNISRYCSFWRAVD